jgi:hypothetical protein
MIRKGLVGARKLSREGLAAVVGEGRAQISMGIVTLESGETVHYERDGDSIEVDVTLVPGGEKVLCRLPAGASSAGAERGVFSIPTEGTEVVVAIPHGELDADPVIIAVFPSVIAEELDESTTVVSAPSVVLKSGASSYVQLDSVVSIGGDPGEVNFHPVPHGDTVRSKINDIITQLNYIIGYVNGIAPGTVPPVPGTALPAVASLPESALSEKVRVS